MLFIYFVLPQGLLCNRRVSHWQCSLREKGCRCQRSSQTLWHLKRGCGKGRGEAGREKGVLVNNRNILVAVGRGRGWFGSCSSAFGPVSSGRGEMACSHPTLQASLWDLLPCFWMEHHAHPISYLQGCVWCFGVRGVSPCLYLPAWCEGLPTRDARVTSHAGCPLPASALKI